MKCEICGQLRFHLISCPMGDRGFRKFVVGELVRIEEMIKEMNNGWRTKR